MNTRLLLAAIVIFILSFPRIEPVIDPGIDPPLLWAYNYFFDQGIQSGTDIIFTHGPLAFLIAPLPMGSNLIAGILLVSFIHFLFIFSFLSLCDTTRQRWWWLLYPLGFYLAVALGTEYAIIAVTACGVLLHSETGKRRWLVIAAFFAVLGFYVKAYIGIMALVNLVAYAFVRFALHRNRKELLLTLLAAPVLFCVIWLLLYHNLSGIGRFLKATIEFSRNNSAAAALYPDNNWWLLTGSILLFLSLPFLLRERKAWAFTAIFALPLFAGWKHGITREDIYHMESFYIYLVLTTTLMVLFSERFGPRVLAASLAALLLFQLNLKNCINYREFMFSFRGPLNFAEVFFQHTKLVEDAAKGTEQRLAGLKLPEAMRAAIGAATVDVYPWNFAYIPANGLAWAPRPVLQSYATYTGWLDRQNAVHFASAKAPKHILWEMITDRWGGQFGGLDDRYALNDEPMTILAILDNYELKQKSDKVLLLSKADTGRLRGMKITGKETSAWDTWIKVPDAGNDILRVRLACKGTFMRFMKTQLYKDEAFYIEYKLAGGSIKKYRIVPETAADGIWVNPLVLHPSNNFSEPAVTEIRFSSTNALLMENGITLEWERVTVAVQGGANALFGKMLTEADTSHFQSSYGFERAPSGDWSGDTIHISRQAYSGSKAYLMEKDMVYSPTFARKLTDLAAAGGSLNITASLWAKHPGKQPKKAGLVISVEENGKAVYWEGVSFESFLTTPGEWLPVSATRQISNSYSPSAVLKVYVMCETGGEVLIDDLEVKAIRNQ